MKVLASAKKGDVEIVLVSDFESFKKTLSKAEKVAFKLRNFKGEGQCFVSSAELDSSCARLFVGLDACEYAFPNALRDAIFSAIKCLNGFKLKSASISAKSTKEVREIAEGALLAIYEFDTFKTKKQELNLEELFINSASLKIKDIEAALSDAKVLCDAVNATRELVNTPPAIATPKYVAKVAKKAAKDGGFECKIYERDFLEAQKMGAFLAVAQASVNEPYLVHLSYKGKGERLPKISLVGKGLTYDSGGLSLKPGDYMTTMKSDKSGACAVLGVMQAVAELGLPVELHGVLGLAENMIGGDAYKPDDILIAKNGKSIEVRNTDAEGRLVLADCLSFASELEPDLLLDMATLTGACVVALGDYSSGVMGYNENLIGEFVRAAFNAGELAAHLPFNPYLKKLIKSDVADICNMPSSRYGAAITAGMFLSEFVSENLRQNWLHIDIAGPAYVEKSWGVNPFGGTGAGVRAVVEFVRSKA